MKKAHAPSADGKADADSPGKEGAPAGEGTPKKARKTPTKETGSAKKRRVEKVDHETEPVLKAEPEGEGED